MWHKRLVAEFKLYFGGAYSIPPHTEMVQRNPRWLAGAPPSFQNCSLGSAPTGRGRAGGHGRQVCLLGFPGPAAQGTHSLALPPLSMSLWSHSRNLVRAICLTFFCSHLQALLGHTDTVTCATASLAYHIIVSGSRDRTCIIWDLNKLSFLTQLRGHRAPVSALCINELTVSRMLSAGLYSRKQMILTKLNKKMNLCFQKLIGTHYIKVTTIFLIHVSFEKQRKVKVYNTENIFALK